MQKQLEKNIKINFREIIIMINNLEVLIHGSIKFKKEKIIYFDPFKIDKNYNDADVIFITLVIPAFK